MMMMIITINTICNTSLSRGYPENSKIVRHNFKVSVLVIYVIILCRITYNVFCIVCLLFICLPSVTLYFEFLSNYGHKLEKWQFSQILHDGDLHLKRHLNKTAANFAVICYHVSFQDDRLISLLLHNFRVHHFVFTNCRKLKSKGLGWSPVAWR